MESNDHLEFERRFLIDDPRIIEGLHDADEISQAYLWSGSGYAIRVRRTQYLETNGDLVDKEPELAVKGPRTPGAARWEKEIGIPLEHAIAIIDSAEHIIEKSRYGLIGLTDTGAIASMEVAVGWDIDVFHDENEGLIIAEYEGEPDKVANLRKAHWCGREITHERRYDNENLAKRPWRTWTDEERGLA